MKFVEEVAMAAMKILIEQRFYYGKEVYYPACDRAGLFAEIAGTRTLTKPTLRKIIQLGYKIEFKKKEFELS
ncbi:MAG: hypothetical protein ABFQ95_00960 [Pseudomonadota bacterium]